jgi:uncharacterized membrane protein YhaH (DUF805 family)
VNPLQAINSVFGHYFDFKGRAMRSEFWWFVLFYILISVIIALVLVQTSERAMSASLGLFFLVTFIPYLAVGARRLHDRNRTGWWQLISLVPLGGFLLLYWWAMPGDPGPNRYGPPPTAA